MSPRITTLLRLGLPAAVLAILAIAAFISEPSAQRTPLNNDSNQVPKNPPSVNSYNNTTPTSPKSGALPDFNFGAAGDW